METELIRKVTELFRYNDFAEKLERTVDFWLKTTVLALASSFFISLPSLFWAAMVALAVLTVVYARISVFFKGIAEAECFARIDSALELKQIAVTYHEITRKRSAVAMTIDDAKASVAADTSIAAIRDIAIEDFHTKLAENKACLESESVFSDKFGKKKITPGRRAFVLAAVCLVMSAALFRVNALSNRQTVVNDQADEKIMQTEAAKVLAAIAADKENKVALPEAIAEVKKTRDVLKNPMSPKELSNTLRETADKLKSLQSESNSKAAREELKKIEDELNALLSGKDGVKVSEDEKKALEEKMAAFRKLVEDYLKKSNDKDFKKVEKEMADLAAALNAKKDSTSSREKSASGKDGKQDSSAGQKQEMSADMKSKLKQLGRMTGKELLEKLKNDKELQEMYASLKAMSEAADDECEGKGDGSKKDSGGNTGDKPGGKKGDGKGPGGISADSLGISIPKPGKGSSNMKEGPSDAPAMVPQERNAAAKKPMKSGEWKAMFEGSRFDVKTEKSKVEGVHDGNVKTSSIEGRAIPVPGEAGEDIKQIVESESQGADSLVSSEAVPDELKRAVSDYFKKLNNDYDQKGPNNGGKDGKSGK